MTPTRFTTGNFVSVMFASFSAISLVVFLVTTQSFFISDALNYPPPSLKLKLSTIIGNLGFYDEVLSILMSPFVGTLSDYSGSKPLVVVGLATMALSFFGFTWIKNENNGEGVYFWLVFWRLVFTVGATCAALMITTMLGEITSAGYQVSDLKRDVAACWRQMSARRKLTGTFEDNLEQETEVRTEEGAPGVLRLETPTAPGKNGLLTAVVGVSTGLGAIWAISVYLPLPTRLSGSPLAVSKLVARGAVVRAYHIVALIALATALVLSYGLYWDRAKANTLHRGFRLSAEDTSEDTDSSPPRETYLASIKTGFAQARSRPQVLLACLGSFVARSSTVVGAVFVPLMMYHYYHNVTGECSTRDTGDLKQQCHRAYILASVVMGISQTVGLLTAPLWGILADSPRFSHRVGRFRASLILEYTLDSAPPTNQSAMKFLVVTGALGLWACGGIALAPNSLKPLGLSRLFHFSLLGAAQTGSSLLSLSLITNQTGLRKGSLAGVYTLAGGVGVLILTKAGGWGSDYYAWIGLPFFILGIFNVALIGWGGWVVYRAPPEMPEGTIML